MKLNVTVWTDRAVVLYGLWDMLIRWEFVIVD
jgi:hypothetical protein